MTEDILTKKLGIETLPAAFTDHLAVVLRLSIPSVIKRRGSRRWKMNPHLMNDADIKILIRHEFEKWRKYKQYYPDMTIWWERCVKKSLCQLIRRAETERYADHRKMENHLYQCIYDILRTEKPEAKKYEILKRYKAKIVCLHARKMEKLMLDIDKQDKIEDEEPSLFHILKRRKRCKAREIRKIQDLQGNMYTQPQDIIDTFMTHLTQKYEHIDVDENSIAIMEAAIPQICPSVYAQQLETPITYEEIITALKAGARQKAPGIDGIGLEFYTHNWDIIKSDLKDLLNQMFSQNKVTSQQKHAIVVNLSKANGDPTPDGYRPISFLATEYKILALIMAQGLCPIMKEQLSSSQFCAVPGNSILEAVATVRDAIT